MKLSRDCKGNAIFAGIIGLVTFGVFTFMDRALAKRDKEAFECGYDEGYLAGCLSMDSCGCEDCMMNCADCTCEDCEEED